MTRITVVGGGLAGSEAALQLAARGFEVTLREMRPVVPTEAHRSDRLAEVVCSNSFKSMSPTHASGLLKEEMKRLGCLLIPIGEECRVEAGTALAIDRDRFAEAVTARVAATPGIRVERGEVTSLPDGPAILATGPLTSEPFARALTEFLGLDRMYFYDSTAPIVSAESIDHERVFAANRRDAGDGHYLNCPFTREEYEAFVQALLDAEQYPLHEFEKATFFESCMPVDDLARRGPRTLAFGPMRPIGLIDPRTGRRPYAVVQLRPENREATAYNLVGFQNRLRHGDQTRVLRMIPGLEHAEFYRLGRVHRNTYLDSPRILDAFLAVRKEPRLALAGQITGLEGYVEAIATGMLAARFLAERLRGETSTVPPPDTALGALLRFVSAYEGKEYRPTNVNFGLFPALEDRRRKGRERNEAFVSRARESLTRWLEDPAAPAPAADPPAGGPEDRDPLSTGTR
ncbi:MAG: methylenetetrahydrofolate--tRNA-(uracil(54)-C(5))-methyltransferase (FADH(2)-oxidizing) TrmFO [Gemmatimonadetes bacterium]|nr:methylenetetrahydrofolate--tRNA-(uracil(54)-C(5))-methyltransferase (FADH(2)-oxidizing) TrmFO [Gemmatimonadota bacterium]